MPPLMQFGQSGRKLVSASPAETKLVPMQDFEVVWLSNAAADLSRARRRLFDSCSLRIAPFTQHRQLSSTLSKENLQYRRAMRRHASAALSALPLRRERRATCNNALRLSVERARYR
eukprot:TRINITY_DN11101_c0_g2_i1.p1 TRINITY_DN11101_c0_g2~~TRINITY_DN11101_c0_g2_i1.p1  ORF type:complete len:117 (+),score=17.27 TRINITY_DN11101_c0_g2_i1:63-413(+)